MASISQLITTSIPTTFFSLLPSDNHGVDLRLQTPPPRFPHLMLHQRPQPTPRRSHSRPPPRPRRTRQPLRH
ncbi:hypothetical protein OPV22_016754 [Ensete ventricosum]|uniref:Uncharacterized protein n=1 Tax=Ensete ventricosum TaxID=4639 RepID=A0AAV8QLU4_ENSVE|nr:hypothetical protein OPV22_016754 [Ensete ventricosum]